MIEMRWKKVDLSGVIPEQALPREPGDYVVLQSREVLEPSVGFEADTIKGYGKAVLTENATEWTDVEIEE